MAIPLLDDAAMAHRSRGDSLAVNGASRSAANIARNTYRPPVQTLQFFGIQPDMTVIEIDPAGGCYTVDRATVAGAGGGTRSRRHR
ncbi:MAG: hypothetical protein EPN69_08655 [Rhodanobacter sp.]|nr:MAG: hypothetical protein EPN69_08655 [Rhodanobacter sp.]TAL96623.1 MAG: hypothetical protein EPN71_09285 [Rhodanobacter sp.]TAM40518.1 MAG: hypothetical protein EPN58_09915 [Rhodanobacter sp.]TAN28593.1 MAG: hypothetical protein EPN32_02750 [Rhodanobacter sp.]